VTSPADPLPAGFVLLDVGGGRQLARYGSLVADRPCPSALVAPADPGAWNQADLRYERPSFGGSGWWTSAASELPTAWTMAHEGLTFELRPTPAGQVGVFAEQMDAWRWLSATIRRLGDTLAPARPAMLNLFAYTGGSTLAAAAAGAAVTHVDASRSAVAWARRNAALSGLAQAPVRWIVDDAAGFVARESRRGRRYHGIVLDPPTYGHGPTGERWVLSEQLPGLLDACLAIADQPGFVLLTAHAEGQTAGDLGSALADAFERAGRRADAAAIQTGDLLLRAESGTTAPAGAYARWRS
jgi:23S rRNA (cytosine1962-C5)-methyltransferase